MDKMNFKDWTLPRRYGLVMWAMLALLYIGTPILQLVLPTPIQVVTFALGFIGTAIFGVIFSIASPEYWKDLDELHELQMRHCEAEMECNVLKEKLMARILAEDYPMGEPAYPEER